MEPIGKPGLDNSSPKEVTETPRTDAMSQEIELQDATYHNAYERARGLCYELELALAEALAWTDEDKPLPEDEAIKAAHPLKTKDFRTHAEAMRLVGAKRSKGALVDLVNWLLRSISEEQRRIELAYQVLEMNGVPRERARSVDNGIGVLATRLTRAAVDAENALREQVVYVEGLKRTVETVATYLEGCADPANPDDRDNWVLSPAKALRDALAKNPSTSLAVSAETPALATPDTLASGPDRTAEFEIGKGK